MTVLLTGAAGQVGAPLAERLPVLGWPVVGFDLVPVPGGIVGDITDAADLDEALSDPPSAIVHFAGQPTEAPWPLIRDANIDGLVSVFEAARRHGVRRVVYASSNHAAGFTANEADLPADVPARPDTLYGVSKVFGEALARYYVDRYDMQVVCLRIGSCSAEPRDRRALSTWLSFDDCARLVDACLRANPLSYAVVWGVSANTRRVWSLAAGRAIGYEPRDDAEVYADRLADAEGNPGDEYVGGQFTGPAFGIDEVAGG